MPRILIAEDSPTQAERLRLILEVEGYQVEVASDGRRALDALRAAAPDVLISDVLMPELDGYELCRRVKDDPALRTVPVVLLTSLAEPMDIIRGLECGADNFLTKPIEPADLLQRVRTILDNKALRTAGKLRLEAEIVFLGKRLTINSDKEQILDLLVGAFEDVIRANDRLRKAQEELRAANATIDEYARRLEGRVRSSEEKYRRLMERANDAILLRETSGRVLEANRRAEELLGRPAAEIVGRPAADFVVPEDRERLHSEARWVLAHGARTDNLRLLRPDGRTVWVDWSSSLVEDGGGRLVLVVAHDVTERREREAALRRSEQALRESERRFQAFMNHSPATAFMKDPEGRFVYVSEPLRRKFPGISEWEGRTDEDLFPEHGGQYRANDAAVLASGRPMEVEEESPAPGGGVLQWMALKFPIEDDSGRRFLGGVAIDVTERKRAEEALRRNEEMLRQSQKMEAVGQLAGGVAHDFNNLLTIIQGYGELVQARLPADDPARPFVEEILHAGELAATLTRQLLVFSRRQVAEPRVLDLNAVVGDTEKLLRRLIGEDVRLATVLGEGLRAVRADPGHVEQVLINLAVNARDAMPHGGRLTVETANADLDETYALRRPDVSPGRYSMVAVSDTGVGMDAATLARAFEPFFTTKGPGKGTGLGLATVYSIVKGGGGHVFVYSEPGRGTTFKIFLPSVDEAPAGTPLAAASPMPGGRETILLVEDEEGVRALSRQVLEMCGYTVLAAADGEEALGVCARHTGPIHLMVSDVVMPSLGGRALAERLAVLKPEMKVLFVSGYADDAVVRHGVLAEGTAFLQKPFTPTALAQTVRRVLDREGPEGES